MLRWQALTATVVLVLASLGCGLVAQMFLPGEWQCSGGASLKIWSDGTINITKGNGDSANGTYTVDGSTLNAGGIWWIEPEPEKFVGDGTRIRGLNGEVCTKAA